MILAMDIEWFNLILFLNLPVSIYKSKLPITVYMQCSLKD